MSRWFRGLAAAVLLAGLAWLVFAESPTAEPPPPNRREVVFWHFWGGKYKDVVDEIAARFNASQDEHYVRAIAMPGKNLDLKFFLSVAGGDPPDIVNQDDPVVADFAHRGILTPLDELAAAEEYARLGEWLFPAARHLATYEGRMYALCNGLDIRALYYDKTYLDERGWPPPQTLDELDALAEEISPPEPPPGGRKRFGYLPDPRRLWAWGIVFGGEFYDAQTGAVAVDSPQVVAALSWMKSYRDRYGANQISSFRKGDQGLTGASSPLLRGRYVMLMDGQWRVAEIAAAQQAARQRGEAVRQYGVVPLPPPTDGRRDAGWVNGNFFIVPRGGRNPAGAWEFMKFWSGFDGHESESARACVRGGWIPASQEVVDEPEFQQMLSDQPMFATFVELAASPTQFPTPVVPGAGRFYAEVVQVAEDTLYRPDAPPPEAALRTAAARIRQALEEADR